MNLGFYVNNTSDTPLNAEIYDLLNKAVEENEVSDATLFYNEIDFNPREKKFGTFNSTDLWSFSGALVVTTLDALLMSSRVVNDIDLIYLYTNDVKNNLMHLLDITKGDTVVTRSTEEQDNFYRLTGRETILLEEFTAPEILKVCNERV